ncbi:MAG TPA: hypothetical protein VK168_11495 [Saprospiraceae bacterium]|nr:hypothetical protein [Saprospiraceae bacterium]
MKNIQSFGFLLLITLYFTACDLRTDVAQDFSTIETLFSDTILSEICIQTVRTNRNFNKFIFIKDGEVYYVNKRLFKTSVYGNHFKEKSEQEVLENFNSYSKLLESKGIIGACISIDSTIKFKLSSFNTKTLQIVDTLNLHKNYKYLCVTKKDIRRSFILPREYDSNLFYFKPFYFYYSNK